MAEARDDAPRRFAHYRVERRPDGAPWKLGSGAMGVTYKAWDEKLRVPVALKVIAPGQIESARAQALFLREARAAARVRQANVASVLFLSDEPGHFFYAMELIDGEPLHEWLPRHRPIGLGFVCGIGGQLARGLAAIHAQQLIHRDLKPANIMMLRAGSEPGEVLWTPKIIDFGLARSTEGPADGEAAALTTGFRGTVLYASPEQCEERDDLDGRSDLYSLGCILWEMLAGAPPFRAKSRREVMNLHVQAPLPTEPSALWPPELRRVVLRLLAKDRGERYASAEAVARELERLSLQLTSIPAVEADETLVESVAAPPPPAAGSVGSTAGLANASTAGGAVPANTATPPAPAPPTRRSWAWAAALVGLAGLGGFGWKQFGPRPSAPPPTGLQTIAVLPFESLGGERENEFFADGLHDDVLASLAKIGKLGVIGRSSVEPYRGKVKPERLKEIGQELGATHLLEGRLRRSGTSVVLNAALTEVRSGLQLWGQRYDRTLANALSLQGELAQEIARELHATLSPEERARVATKPTGDSEAYLVYLRARQAETRPGGTLANFQEAVRLYHEAIERDPRFALARARIASTLTYIYLNSEPSEAVRDRARREADEALRLQPELGQAHVAKALCFYRLDRNYEEALRWLQNAARLQPNDLDVESTIAYIQRRQGRWVDAATRLDRVLARDIRSPVAAEEVFIIRTQMRQWPEAESAARKTLALTGQTPAVGVNAAWLAFWAREDLGPVRSALEAVPLSEDPDGAFTLARWDTACLARDFAAATRAVTQTQATLVLGNFGIPFSRNYLLGAVALAQGRTDEARPLLEAARAELEAEVRALPGSTFRRAQLGLVQAYLGEREAALREGRKAVELTPEKNDAVDGPTAAAVLALIHARLGLADEALELVERLLHTPGAALQSFEASLSLADLRHRWQWDPLRGHERFRRIVGEGGRAGQK
ncbi:MAG: protein kinase [Verrucomicrobia bacterium]|nr:protein kinase [Verrucomicrobiota bacterium]